MTEFKTAITELFGIDYPIIQAAMGPVGTVELASAVSEAGGLGMISIGSEIVGEREARKTFQDSFDFIVNRTDRNFGVNIPAGSAQMPENIVETLDAYLEEVLVSKLSNKRVSNQLKVLETSAGSPERWMEKINDVTSETDLVHFHKVASVKHAKKAESLGVDGITASGYEMGGHTHRPEDATHTFVLLPAVTEAVDLPVIASGGIKDGRGLLAALALGTEGAYMGTRFMLTEEADFHDDFKEYVLNAGPGSDTLVQSVYGPGRVIESPGVEQVNEVKDELNQREFMELADQKAIIAQQGNVEEGIIPGGQVAGYIDDKPTVEDLIQRTMREAAEAYENLPVA